MNISLIKIKSAVLILFFLSNFVQANELWVHEQSNLRSYLILETTDAGIELKHYSQLRGEYQTLLNTYKFKNNLTLNKFISANFPTHLATLSLPGWPISQKFNATLDKGFSSGKNQYIWLAKNQWSQDWEESFGKWLTNVTPDFYKKYKIKTDCADAVIGFRWIFSRIHSLPVANSLADTGELFGQFSMKKAWQKYDTAENWYDDRLFLAALNYVMDLTSTRTIVHDGFPVAINLEGLIPGVFIVTQNNGAGHAKVITETHYEEVTELPLYTLASTSPRDVRELIKEVFLDQGWPEKGNKEILGFRWPILKNGNWVLQAKNARPSYSLEQFDSNLQSDFPTFIEFILSRVKVSYDPLKLVELGVQDILTYVIQRIDIVTKGYQFCRKNNCALGSIGNEEWGTPSRDKKLLKKFHDIDTLVKEFENIAPGLYDRWITGLRKTTIEVEGVSLKLSSLRFILENDLFSSLPLDTPDKRWGLNSDELLSKWMSSVEKKLNERNSIISRPDNPCWNDCYPKTNLWVGLSTYPVDAELNNLYTQITTYCTFIDIKECHKIFASIANKQLEFGPKVLSLESWFNSIPYFNSDPRSSIGRRWGSLPSNTQARVLPYFDTVKVSENSLALLDSSKLMNLKIGKIIYETTKDSRLFLTKAGVVYKINDGVGNIKRMIINEEKISWTNIIDSNMILNLQKERPLYIEEDRGYTIFRKLLPQGLITFRIVNDEIEFIKENSGVSQQFGPLITFALDKETMSFIDLDRTIDVVISIPSSNDFFDMNYLQVSSYKYPNVVLSYKDRDQDLYYSVLVDLEKRTWNKIAADLNEKYLVLWSEVTLKKALIQTSFNSEFPSVYAVSWDDQHKFSLQKMSNLLLDIKVSDQSVFFISGTGGAWDQNPKKKLYSWDKVLIEKSSPPNFEVKFLTSEGAYFSSAEKGILRIFRDTKDLNLPKDLLPESEFCQIQSKTEEIFSYRFGSSYGDYFCMGGSLLKSQISNLKDDLVPQFSQYSWINKESLLDLRWQKSFLDFEIENGLLIGLGKNIGLWWANND